MSTAPTKVLVAVHGIGDQTHFETLQHVVNLCFGHSNRPKGVPIGYLHSALAQGTQPWAATRSLPGLGFAEVFWADIAREAEQYTLEEPVSWAHTIVARLQVVSGYVGSPAPFDYDRITRTLTDMAFAIRLIRLLNRGLTAVGIGSVDMDKLLVRFLGDVQLYAEFEQYRERITGRFHDVMTAIDNAADKNVEIHICGHSQGSVVAFLGLLEGYRYRRQWLARVRSFITIGSPIDKFLVLWPELWDPYAPMPKTGTPPPGPGIDWLNYADRGDPVGYELDTARKFVEDWAPGLFKKDAPEDSIFRRYTVPGKAHVDYWKDQELFDQWLGGTVLGAGHVEPVKDLALARTVGPLLPFGVSAAFAGVAGHFVSSGINRIEAAGQAVEKPADAIEFAGVLAISLLILGIVSLAAAARTSLRWKWFLIGGAMFVLGGAATLWVIEGELTAWTSGPALHVIVALGIVALVQNVFNRFVSKEETSGGKRTAPEPRKKRLLPPLTERRTVTWLGIILVVLGTFIYLTFELKPNQILAPALSWLVALAAWALAVVMWDVAIVWIEYVSEESHMEYLEDVWRVEERPPEIAPEERAPVWWLRTPEK